MRLLVKRLRQKWPQVRIVFRGDSGFCRQRIIIIIINCCERAGVHYIIGLARGAPVHTGGQTQVYLTPMHAEGGLIKKMIANIQAALAYVRRAAEQLPKLNRWHALVGYICERITGQTVLPTLPPALQGAG